ncbi:MAG: alpha/beta fold hydrolase [Hydrogenophaga sp.]
MTRRGRHFGLPVCETTGGNMNHKKITTALFAAMMCLGGLVQAEEVSIAHSGLHLVGELRVPEGGSLTDGPLVLMTHGTLAHGGMEIMQAMQQGLEDQGVASLAINLSLGLDSRRGMYDCGVTHTHRHTDAMGEIGAWLKWAKGRGAKDVVLLGHSRGGNQTAWFAAENDDASVRKVVLVAPATWSRESRDAAYRNAYGKDLADVYRQAQRVNAANGGKGTLKAGFIYCPDAEVTAASFVDYYADEPRMDTPSLFNKINEQVLVIAGSEDTVVEGLIEKTAPAAEDGKVQLVVIDGADHFFLDLYAEEAVDAIVDFLND